MDTTTSAIVVRKVQSDLGTSVEELALARNEKITITPNPVYQKQAMTLVLQLTLTSLVMLRDIILSGTDS